MFQFHAAQLEAPVGNAYLCRWSFSSLTRPQESRPTQLPPHPYSAQCTLKHTAIHTYGLTTRVLAFRPQESIATFAAAITEAEGGTPSRPRPIMIATDLAARGLDFPGTVDHVVNFDFPATSVDYLHRSGRTARAGKTGEGCAVPRGAFTVACVRLGVRELLRVDVRGGRMGWLCRRQVPLPGSLCGPVCHRSQLRTLSRNRNRATAASAQCVTHIGPSAPAPTQPPLMSPWPLPISPPSNLLYHAGKITSIVSKRDKVLAQRIEYALQRDEPLDALSADPDRLPPSQVSNTYHETFQPC